MFLHYLAKQKNKNYAHAQLLPSLWWCHHGRSVENGRCWVFFVEPEVKINAKYYWDVLLSQQNVICYQACCGWQFRLSAGQRTCASSAWHNRTPAAWKTWFHFARATAPTVQTWTLLITRFGESSSSVQDAATGWHLERSVGKCCRRCCQRAEKESICVCSHEGRILWTSDVSIMEWNCRLTVYAQCVFEVFNKIIIWHRVKRCNFCFRFFAR